MNIKKCMIFFILTALQEAKGNSNTKCNVQNDIADCSHLVLTTIPRHLPVNATSLDLSKNSINIVKGFTFQYLRNITDLNLGYNLIQIIEINAFHGLHRLRSLHLNDNSLTKFPDGMFDNLNWLQDLSIDSNKLQYFQDNKIKELSKILSPFRLTYIKISNFQVNGLR